MRKRGIRSRIASAIVSALLLLTSAPALCVAVEQPKAAPSQVQEPAFAAPAETDASSSNDLAAMDLESLMNVEITTGTLTNTARKLVPAAVTTINRDDIDHANPRSLYELLDIYVPNMYWTYHQWEMPHIGFRGIINADDKQLLLVNGRMVNERTRAGTLTERDLVLLGDLNHVDVIRGPGSAIYGPGGIAGVIDLETFNGLTYQGTEITARGGIYEEFYSLEAKHGQRTGPNSGWFVYGGAAKYNGADRAYSPFVQGLDFTQSNFNNFEQLAGHPYDYQFEDLHATYASNPQLKFHAQFDSDGLTLWTRYTNGGQMSTISDRGWMASWPYGWLTPDPAAQVGVGYQQLTAFAGYKHPLTDKLTLDLSTSMDFTEYERITPSAVNNVWVRGYSNSHGEIKNISKALLHWTPSEAHQLAAGVEYMHMWLGLPSWRTPSLGGFDDRFAGGDMPRWQTEMLSFVGEYQWTINDNWTTFLGGRADKHTYTDWLFSPRAALAFSPTDQDTIKLIASQSLRTNTEQEMRLQWQGNGADSDPEKMITYELRYERQQNKDLTFAASAFYNDLDVLAWDQSVGASHVLGSLQTIGAEGEANYRTGDTTITFSHGIVKLLDMEIDDGITQQISAKPLGIGRDLASWPSQITKLTVHQQLSRHWSADGSVRVDWSFPGDKDFLQYANAHPVNNDPFAGAPPSSNAGWDEPYGPSVFVNFGIENKLTDHATLRLDAYNILGWADQAFNKRDFAFNNNWAGQYRAEAPALGISFRYEF